MISVIRILNLTIYICMILLVLIGTPFLLSKLTNRPVYTDPAFSKYLLQFEADAKKYNTPLNLYKLVTVFSNTINIKQTRAVAFCLPATKTVVISKPIWDVLTEDSRKALLYHEWGHCVLRREHVEDYNYVSFCPISIMYPYIDPLKYCYSQHQESYNRELFTNPFNFKTFSRSKK